MNKRLTRISKYMSFILVHQPGSIGLSLDDEGWTGVTDFVAKANASGKTINADQVFSVIQLSEVKRFELSQDGQRVRAIGQVAKSTQPNKPVFRMSKLTRR